MASPDFRTRGRTGPPEGRSGPRRPGKGIEAAERAADAHEVDAREFSAVYVAGVDSFRRQGEANKRTFSALVTVGQIGAEAVGLPPGITQVLFGALAALLGKAGWLRVRKAGDAIRKAVAKRATPG